MAITYPLAMQSRNPKAFTLKSRNVVGINTAPTSLVAQRYRWVGGERWEGELNFGSEVGANGRDIAGWLTSLLGAYGTFLAGDPSSATARGSAGVTPGTPVVSGSHSALSQTLAISTGLGTVTGYLKRGDFISLGSGSTRRLHQILQDLNLTAGAGTADIWPSLRTSYSNGTTVVVANTTARFFMTSTPEWTVDKGGTNGSVYTFAPVSCVEDLS